MSEWREYKLGEITTKIGDGLHGTPMYDDNGDYCFVNGNNLSKGRVLIKPDTKRVNENEFFKYRKPLSDKTILLGINGTYGNLAFYNGEKCILGKSACYINVSDDVDKYFLYYNFLNSDFQLFLDSIATGTTIPNVPLKGLREYSILLPPLPEQRAIASVLSSLDDKIDLLHRQNKTLEAMAETLFRQWFVEEADEGWEEGKLSQLVEIQSGFAFKSEIFVDIGKYKLITIKAVQDGYLELNNADEINEIPPRMPSYCHLIEKDILLSLTGNIGRCCMVDKLNLLLNQRVAKVHPKNENDRAFAYFYFRLRDTRQQLEEMAKGTAQLNLSPVETANMILSIPSRDLLDKFSEISTPLFEGILRNKKNISTLEKLRDTLLPKLMSGEVRVECS